ncbi:MAG: glycosyltransferase family 2 protein, partial [Cyclobacteriaceae bacterium]|nr:glycosyltransferase family 2 protein [Cyclobacteriaceae bacterium]
TGACLFIRSEIYNQMGGFDESFFAHMEEIDLCWRINNDGHSVFYCGSSTVFHVGGGTLSRANPKKTYLNFKNGLTLLFKNLPFFHLFWILPLRLLLDLVASVKFFFFDSHKDAFAIIKAHWDFTFNFFDNIRSRKRVSKIIPSRKIHPAILKGFIIFFYYLFKRKYFSDLKFYHKK